MDISVRLKEERERLGMTQEAFGQSGGVLKRAVIHYERGERVPDALFLTRVAAAGADVLYILTGQRSKPIESTLTTRQKALLDNYAHTDAEGQRAIEQVALVAAKQAGVTVRKSTRKAA